MLAIALLVIAAVVMWAGRRTVRWVAARASRSPTGSRGATKAAKRADRAIAYLTIVGVVVAYPLLMGEELLAYYGRLLPLDRGAMGSLYAFSVAVLFLAVIFLAWVATDNLRFRVRHKPRRLAGKLAVVPISAVLGALTEEVLFRGVVMADLLEWFEPIPAAAIGAVLFACAHYMRRVKRYWTFPGHVVLGVMLCATFVFTRTLWAPIGLHAGGILITLGTRPFVRYTGSPWLVGASIFPYAGPLGIVALLLLTGTMWMAYGGPG